MNHNKIYKGVKMKKKIVLTGGGTAGHVYPALAVAEELNQYDISYVGGNGMEKQILQNYPNIKYHEIPTVKLERKFTFKNLLIPFKLIKSISVTKKVLKDIKPDIIFSKGGFVAVPVVFAAKKLHIPIISHESDLSFGLANKLILKKCTVMCTTFNETAKCKKCVHTGQPIRSKIFNGKRLHLFDNQNPTLLVLGGSLGAKFLNEIIFNNIEKLTKNFNIIHICGKQNERKLPHKNYFQTAYAENIEDYYATADIVLARSGSGVINELLALSKPMLLVPLSKKCSRGDQIENAKNFTNHGYAQMLEEEDYSFEKLTKKLTTLAKNREKYIKNMQKTAKNNAVSKIVKLINQYSIKQNF